MNETTTVQINSENKYSSKGLQIRHLDWLSSVWSINSVNPLLYNYDVETNALKELHIAPFPVELAHRLILLYSQKGDWVLDPFCGSGTTNYAALSLFRKTAGYDIEEKYIQMAEKRCGDRASLFSKSSENMKECGSDSIQLCITSPPYLNLRHYSDNPENIGNMRDPYPALRKVFREIYRVLKPGGYFCMNAADVPDGRTGYATTFPYDLIYLCQSLGFRLRTSLIWNKGITLKKWNIVNKEPTGNHEYVWVFRKPDYGGGRR
ncbi:MAG: site-specific DNA-methyltransferase [Candidatus Omnitrophota bacterium]